MLASWYTWPPRLKNTQNTHVLILIKGRVTQGKGTVSTEVALCKVRGRLGL